MAEHYMDSDGWSGQGGDPLAVRAAIASCLLDRVGAWPQRGDRFWHYNEILIQEDKVETRYSRTVWPRLGNEAHPVSQIYRTESDAIRAILKDMEDAKVAYTKRLAELESAPGTAGQQQHDEDKEAGE